MTASLHQAFSTALLDPSAPVPAQVSACRAPTVACRFAVYQNNVMSSLVAVLADTFPVVHALVGAEFFAAMAQAFVRAEPPQSPLMHTYGATMAAWIEHFEPASGLPYLADVARLEWAYLQAWHAADAEPISANELLMWLQALEQPDCNATTMPVIALHPSVHVLDSPHPIHSLWSAHQHLDSTWRDGQLGQVDLGQAESVVVFRQNDLAQVVRVERRNAQTLARVWREQHLAVTLASSALTDVASWLEPLVTHRLLVSSSSGQDWRSSAP